MAHEKADPRSIVSSLSGQWLPVLAMDPFSGSDRPSRTNMKPSVKLQSSALSHVHTWRFFLDLFCWAKWNQSAYPVLSFMSFTIWFQFSFKSYYFSWSNSFTFILIPGLPIQEYSLSFLQVVSFSYALQINARQPDGSTNCIINYSNSPLRGLPWPPVMYEGYIHLLVWYPRPEPTDFCKLKPVPPTPQSN